MSYDWTLWRLDKDVSQFSKHGRAIVMRNKCSNIVWVQNIKNKHVKFNRIDEIIKVKWKKNNSKESTIYELKKNTFAAIGKKANKQSRIQSFI